MQKYYIDKYITDNVATTAPPPSGACDGVPTTDWSCCSSSSPCNVGGGDCDRDSHCASGLSCGSNNCLADFSTLGSSWSSSADCCEGMCKKHLKNYTSTFQYFKGEYIRFYLHVYCSSCKTTSVMFMS